MKTKNKVNLKLNGVNSIFKFTDKHISYLNNNGILIENKRGILYQDICELSRRLFEVYLKTGKNNLYAPLLLCEFLNHFGDCSVKICGGNDKNYGILDKDFIWQKHYWVEINKNGEVYIADIIADRFGYKKIIFLTLEKACFMYKKSDQKEVNQIVIRFKKELGIEKILNVS